MSIDSALKRLKEVDEQFEEFYNLGKYKLWRRILDDELNKFIIEWFTLLKFSDNQIELFNCFCLMKIENFPNREIILEEWFEVIYDSTIQTLIVLPKKGR